MQEYNNDMNWLAHLYLSEADAESRLGNLLADFVKGKARDSLSPRMQHGIRCHQMIDAFTDYHPVFCRSKTRISLEHRRFAGILIDVFYDHFLAKNWSLYSAVSLDQFTTEIYDSMRAYAGFLPTAVKEHMEAIIAADLLGSYEKIDGIAAALERLSRRLQRRLQRDIALEKAIADLHNNYDELKMDFSEFFPEICRHVQNWQQACLENDQKIPPSQLRI